jgi:chaperonin cofactor prefoldin
MSVESSIDDTATSIVSALSSHDLSDEEKEQITKLVGQLLVKTVEKTTKNHLKAAANCCGPEIDLAHQIREEMNRKKDVLISNLKALR